jgi:hypothetical protein
MAIAPHRRGLGCLPASGAHSEETPRLRPSFGAVARAAQYFATGRAAFACLLPVRIALQLGADVSNAKPMTMEHVDPGTHGSRIADISGGGERVGVSSLFLPNQICCEVLPEGPGTPFALNPALLPPTAQARRACTFRAAVS